MSLEDLERNLCACYGASIKTNVSCVVQANGSSKYISDFTPGGVVKLICSSERCSESPYMHAACFDLFEEAVLHYVNNAVDRAHVWMTEAVCRAVVCECACGLGNVRKDVEWSPRGEGGGNDQNLNRRGHLSGGGATGGGGGGRRRRKKSRHGIHQIVIRTFTGFRLLC
jgi:hypothetical protein